MGQTLVGWKLLIPIREQNLCLKWYRRIQTINFQLIRNGSASLLVHCCFYAVCNIILQVFQFQQNSSALPARHPHQCRPGQYNCISSLVVSDLQFYRVFTESYIKCVRGF